MARRSAKCKAEADSASLSKFDFPTELLGVEELVFTPALNDNQPIAKDDNEFLLKIAEQIIKHYAKFIVLFFILLFFCS